MKTVLQKNTEQSRKGDYKMKKLLALVCMITCIFGLTACGSEEALTEYEQQKSEYAQQLATQNIISLIMTYTDETYSAELDNYTVEEIEYIIGNNYMTNVEGYAFLSAVESFKSGLETIGSVVSIGETSAVFDDDQIIVTVQIDGELKDAEAEVIFSNDMFMVMESAALNPVSTMGDLMTKAALNTLIGMGTVFVVLILICAIIYCFALIPKIQDKFSKKKDKKEAVKTTGVDNAVTQIQTQESGVDVSDDLELVAVIAAAIAASEGAASTDGFVVRSIRKVNKGRR